MAHKMSFLTSKTPHKYNAKRPITLQSQIGNRSVEIFYQLQNINVVIDPVRIIMDEGRNISLSQNSSQRKTFTFGRSRSNVVDSSNPPICVMTIHRDDCSKPRISDHSKITWDTRICFHWRCQNMCELRFWCNTMKTMNVQLHM